MTLASATRRTILSAVAIGAALLPGTVLAQLVTTPRQASGPFYPLELPRDDDNDLTRVAGQSGSAAGEVIHVTGRVLDPSGAVIHGARVELWQANAAGRYHHPSDPGTTAWDDAFQGYGQTMTDAGGAYRFKTVRPGLYPSRTRHLHFRISAPGFNDLTTQMYFDGEPRNDDDILLRGIPFEKRKTVIVAFEALADESGSEAGVFDIVLG